MPDAVCFHLNYNYFGSVLTRCFTFLKRSLFTLDKLMVIKSKQNLLNDTILRAFITPEYLMLKDMIFLTQLWSYDE